MHCVPVTMHHVYVRADAHQVHSSSAFIKCIHQVHSSIWLVNTRATQGTADQQILAMANIGITNQQTLAMALCLTRFQRLPPQKKISPPRPQPMPARVAVCGL
eukprot:scaffold54849_cov23-Tisochrysis_lutea.AAC.1